MTGAGAGAGAAAREGQVFDSAKRSGWAIMLPSIRPISS